MKMTQQNNNIVKLKKITNRETNKARASLVEESKEIIDNLDFPIQGYALIAWGDGGNHSISKYYTRRDFPIICLPEYVKQSLLRCIYNQ